MSHFPQVKIVKYRPVFQKKLKLYHLKITLQHCFLLRNVQNLIIAVRFLQLHSYKLSVTGDKKND